MFIHPTSQRTAWNEKTCYTKESSQIIGLRLMLIILFHHFLIMNQKSVNFSNVDLEPLDCLIPGWNGNPLPIRTHAQ